MHDYVEFLKGAVSTGPNCGINGCYILRDGMFYARNQVMQAGISIDGDAVFSVPADEFNSALARIKNLTSINVNGSTLTVKGGRLKSSIECNADEPPELPEMPMKWTPCPPGFLTALGLARPFIGTLGWSQGIRLMEGRVTAMSNTAGIDISVPGLDMPAALISNDVAEFLIKQEPPESFAYEPNALTFQWEGGRWLRAQLLTDIMPDLDKVFDAAGNDAPIKITNTWREAYEDASALSDGVVVVTAAGLEARKGSSVSNVDMPMESLSADHSSRWVTKVMDNVIACADAWNPASYPSPCLFLGPGLRGVVVGQR